MIPAGILLFTPDAPFLGGFALQEVEREAPEGGEIFSGISGACPALIFAELHIEHPMELIFDAPVAADSTSKTRGVARKTCQEVAPFRLDDTLDFAHGFNHTDTL